ncbi:haloacid dehalogenase type II [Nocardia sp. NPDC020380]|uniref:haloacid dehalogenase type II n=1 Tax=Nocardia sp. NPDC020380 TaxID=3364309 RepID=UPI0037A11102
MFDPDAIEAITFDIFGTTVDWYTGVSSQAETIFRAAGVDLEAGGFVSEWRAQYLPALERVRDGERKWAYLDTLHRESLDELLERHGVAAALDDDARNRLVRTWHRLPAWPDATPGLKRLRTRYTVAALSNGGFALMTRLIKSENLPFDCVLSAELARTYKPGSQAYLTAAELLDLPPDRILMVAAHRWDLAGARSAGFHTAYVERPYEKGPDSATDRTDPAADLNVNSFPALAAALGC